MSGVPARFGSRAVAGAVFAAFVLYYGLCCFGVTWAADFQMYCAGVAQLYRDFAAPGHEAMNVGSAQSTVYTAYLVAVAGVGKLLSLTPYRALQLAGVFNLCVYATAVLYLFSRYSLHRRIALPAALFVLVTLLLRWKHFGWSSETSAVLMPYLQAYPSTLGWALAFLGLALVEDVRQRGARWGIALGACLGLSLLTHVLTASWAIGLIGLRALHVGIRDRNLRTLLVTAAATAGAIAVAALWPYYPFFGQTSLTDIVEPGAKFGEHPFVDFLTLYAVGGPAAVWLLARARAHLFWVLAFAASFAALLLWQALGIDFGDRYSFFMAMPAQLVVAEAAAAGALALRSRLDEVFRPGPSPLAGPAELGRADRAAAVVLLAGTIAATVVSPMWKLAHRTGINELQSPRALIEAPSPHDAYYRRFSALAPHLGPDDVVLTPVSRDVFDLASVTGARVVSAPNAHRVPDKRRRRQDVVRFFRKGTRGRTLRAIADRYGATRVLLPRRDFARIPRLARSFGEPIYREREFAVFAIR